MTVSDELDRIRERLTALKTGWGQRPDCEP